MVTYHIDSWKPDILGNNYESRMVRHTPDYAATVRSTVVRRKPLRSDLTRGILYVHGFGDYFFQKEMAEEFTSHGWAFYAVDLRKCGRSLAVHDKKFQVRNLKEYYSDLQAALDVMSQEGICEMVILGHSLGGLVATCFLARKGSPLVKGLILNSPFLNFRAGWLKRHITIPVVSTLGRLFPKLSIDPDYGTAYGESLHSVHHGDWEFDTHWKPIYIPTVELAWIRAMYRSQRWLRRHPECVKVPVLLLRSDHSVEGKEWTDDFAGGDAILNVDHISRYGRHLSADLTEEVVPDGLHDLSLSQPEVRKIYYQDIFSWLDSRFSAAQPEK